jgi:hypothetical protein
MTVGNESIVFVNSDAQTIRAVQMKSETNERSEAFYRDGDRGQRTIRANFESKARPE